MKQAVHNSRSNQKGPLLSAYLPSHQHKKKEGPAPAGLSSIFGKRTARACRNMTFQAGGSMTVEAALVLPLFIFFFANILFFFEMIRLQSNMLAALHQTGTEISEYAYFYRYGLEDLSDITGSFLQPEQDEGEGEKRGEGTEVAPGSILNSTAASYGISLMMSETYVRSRVNSLLGRDYLDHTCLEGGSGGISYLRSRILAGAFDIRDRDHVYLVADYRVKPLISLLAPTGFSLQSRYYGHAWVGYSLGAEEDGQVQENEGTEPIVFITPTGTVYHRSRSCTYLSPSVKAVSALQVRSLRNDSGGKYYPCEACRPGAGGTVYITSYGNRYHSSSACRSLKRTILEVPLSSVEDHMKACSKCGG